MRFRNKKVTVLIDVRSRLEFFFGRVPGAICIPVGKISAAAMESRGIARDADVLVYCASGARSAVAVRALKQAGYTRVMDGGGLADVRKHLKKD
jgi:phage shock protein E